MSSKARVLIIVLLIAIAIGGWRLWAYKFRTIPHHPGRERVVLQPDVPTSNRRLNAVVDALQLFVNENAAARGWTVGRQHTDQIVIEFPKKDVLRVMDLGACLRTRFDVYWLRDVRSSANPEARWEMLTPKRDTYDEPVCSFRDTKTGKTLTGDSQEAVYRVLKEVVDPYQLGANPGGVKPLLTGDNLYEAAAAGPGSDGQQTIELRFDNKGARILADFTKRHIGGHLAMLVGDRISAVTIIREPITDGRLAFPSAVSSFEATRRWATFLNAGSPPILWRVVKER